MRILKSPRLYLERMGVIPTLRRPAPAFASDNPVHTAPLVVNPLPATRLHLAGRPSPDRLVTKTWPNGGVPTE